jgi:Zn-dependent alcohol dehydrogenase
VFTPLLIDLSSRRELPLDYLLGRMNALEETNQTNADMEHGGVVRPLVRY